MPHTAHGQTHARNSNCGSLPRARVYWLAPCRATSAQWHCVTLQRYSSLTNTFKLCSTHGGAAATNRSPCALDLATRQGSRWVGGGYDGEIESLLQFGYLEVPMYDRRRVAVQVPGATGES